MNRGYLLTPRSWKDKRFQSHLIFGTAAGVGESYLVPSPFFPDQNKDKRPTECTAYLVADSAFDHNLTRYSEDYNYMKTLQIMNEPPTSQGADLRSAFLVPNSFGLLARDDEPASIQSGDQTSAATQQNWPLTLDDSAKKSQKAFVSITGYLDFSSNAQSFMWLTKDRRYTVGVGTMWYGEFEVIKSDGVLPDNPTFATGGHAYKLCGWKPINGKNYWIVKSWQGPTYGDNGYCYMSFDLMNRLQKQYGAAAYALVDLDDQTVSALKQQQVGILEVIKDLLANIVIKIRSLYVH